MNTLDRFRGCLLGLAAGDAVGTTVEFKPRGSFDPIDDMLGGGPFRLPKGAWTDDTSMALCLAASLVESHGFDAQDQMERYLRWYNQGYMSSTGRCFDIGNTVRSALNRFHATGDPFSGNTDPLSAGNGCIMRLAPVPMFYYKEPIDAIFYAAESARTTHGAQECLDATRLFAAMLIAALAGADKETILHGRYQSAAGPTSLSPKVQALADGAYRSKPTHAIKGSGYVVECLEAALWCFDQTHDFRSAVLCAANLGDDADTTAAVCGQIAGAHYGVADIPEDWRASLVMAKEIDALAEGLLF